MVRIRGRSYQADVTVNGVRKRVSFYTLEEARLFEAAALKGCPNISSLAFKPFHEQNFEYIWGDNKAPEATRQCLAALDKFIPSATLLSDMNAAFILNTVAQMKKTRVSNSTINRRLATLSRLLRHAERLEVISQRPYIEFLREPHGRERVLSDTEEKRMDRYFKHMGLQASWALAFFLLYTGCRVGEARHLSRDRVSDNRATFHYTTTKTTTTRRVPLVGPARAAWDSICEISEAECPFSILTKDTFRTHWDKFRQREGFADDKEFVPHMLRHTCASRLVSNGVPLAKVMIWMGHTAIQTTLRYAHLAPDDLLGVGDALWKD